jgi:hypothetical protein
MNLNIVSLYNSKKFWGCLMFLSILGLSYCLLIQDYINKGYVYNLRIDEQKLVTENGRIAGLSEVGYWCFSFLSISTYIFLLISKEPLFEKSRRRIK